MGRNQYANGNHNNHNNHGFIYLFAVQQAPVATNFFTPAPVARTPNSLYNPQVIFIIFTKKP